MKFLVMAVAGFSVSLAADNFEYVWAAESGREDECDCQYIDLDVDDVNECIVTADKIGCGYTVFASGRGFESGAASPFVSLFANRRQQVFRMPAFLIPPLQFQDSKTPIVSRAIVELDMRAEVMYNNPNRLACTVTVGTYAAENDPEETIPVESRLEEGTPFKLDPDVNGSIDLAFVTKGFNYLLVTNNYDSCDLTGGITNFTGTSYFSEEYAFIIGSTTPEPPSASTTSEPPSASTTLEPPSASTTTEPPPASTTAESPSTSAAPVERGIGLIMTLAAMVLGAVVIV